MLDTWQASRLPLPKGWPERVRSAVVNVISLAHFSIVYTRSWCSNNRNARIRLQAHNSRLRQEITLLTEELRIKDARMMRISAQRRPLSPDRASGDPRTSRRPWLERRSDRTPAVGDADHIWLCDLTAVPTSLGFWTSWMPLALPQRWPFCWWAAVAIDHYSRRAMGVSVFPQIPTSVQVRAFLGRAIKRAGRPPKHLITDHGSQFTDAGFARWCRRRRIQQRFGAVGKYGSVAVIERFIRSMKDECTRLLLVPYQRDVFRRELLHFIAWYNGNRPHTRLDVRTPDEVYFERPPACLAPRLEPRRHWPRASLCSRPKAEIDGRRGARLELAVKYRAGRKHLPVVTLRRVA